MQSINFDNNFKTFCLNEDENNVIRINTSDFGIFERLEEVKKDLENLQKEAKQIESSENEDGLQCAHFGEIDNKIREKINYVFGSDVATPAFGTARCFSFCNGAPMFENFLNAVIPIIEKDMAIEIDKMQANIGKYTNQLPGLVK